MPSRTYHCGTLTYTLPRFSFVLFWILVGSAIIAVGTQLPSIMLPVQLKELGISETAKVFVLSTIGSVMNMTVCPYIGVVSDWHRGKWGRRIPYIFLSMPPIVLSLVLFAFSQQLGELFARMTGFAPVTMTVAALSLTMLLFQFFSMWVNSVLWYIFNDIIPTRFLGTAMAAFRIGLNVGPALFYYFLFQYAQSHSALLYLGIAVLYFIGVGLFCLFVREGEYPPLSNEQLAIRKQPFQQRMLAKWKGLGTFIKESFCGRIYIYRYLFQFAISGATCANIFILYLYRELGITDDLAGKFSGMNGILTTVGLLVVSVLAAEVVNRWHPMRVEMYFRFFTAALFPLSLRWLFGTLPPKVFVWIGLASGVCNLFLLGLTLVCSLPAQMLLFPKSRFGSFCSMQSLLRSFVVILVSFLAGGLFDLLKVHFGRTMGNPDFAFRYMPVWAIPWDLMVPVFGFLLYREWGRLGGLSNYSAPACWEPSGYEAMESMPVKPVSPGGLLRCLPVFDAFYVFFSLFFPIYALWQCRWRPAIPLGENASLPMLFHAGGDPGMLYYYLVVPMLLVVLADAAWLFLRHRIQWRARRVLCHEEENRGLLHPGMAILILMTGGSQILVAMFGNLYANGRMGYLSLALAAATFLLMTGALCALACMEFGMPQPVAISPVKQ